MSDTSSETSWGASQAQDHQNTGAPDAGADIEPIDPVEPQPAELPEAPVHPDVSSSMSRVEMFGSGGLDWQRVSSKLATTRTIVLLVWMVPLLAAAVLLGINVSTWWGWLPLALFAALTIWGLVIIPISVRAKSYIELEEDLVTRSGRLIREVSSIPYGRLQYVDLQSGPLERRYGMATVQIHTASPSTSATIPGLPIATAEELRDRLMQRGEAQRAGL
ncbi:MAG: PH domain-containing protein [Actinomycetia bacterium]|nr:PH domain-containing protein [Actinomycetes bacterium]